MSTATLDLASAILADVRGAPPPVLSRLLGGEPRPATPGPGLSGLGSTGLGSTGLGSTGLASTGLGLSGLGTSAARAFSQPSAAEPAEGELFCPGALRDDPALAAAVDDAVADWADRIGIYPGRRDKLRSYGFGRFLMLAHPAANDVDRLVAATKCLVAEWAADDYYVDEVSLGADPAVVGSRLATLMAVIDPARMVPRYAADLDEHHRLRPISRAFRSAVDHLARYASPAQLGRFQHQVAMLFLASAQEADWRVNRRTPPVWEYLVQRQSNSYLPPMVLIDVLAGYELPAHEFYAPEVRRAFTTAGNAAVLVNDLYSASRESDADFNLPAVLVANEQLSRRQAVLRTVEIHNELMHTFVGSAARLHATGSPHLRRFLADTWAWLGGSRHWHATTARYRNRS